MHWSILHCSVCPSMHPFVCASFYASLRPSIGSSILLPVGVVYTASHLFMHLPLYPNIHVSECLSINNNRINMTQLWKTKKTWAVDLTFLFVWLKWNQLGHNYKAEFSEFWIWGAMMTSWTLRDFWSTSSSWDLIIRSHHHTWRQVRNNNVLGEGDCRLMGLVHAAYVDMIYNGPFF